MLLLLVGHWFLQVKHLSAAGCLSSGYKLNPPQVLSLVTELLSIPENPVSLEPLVFLKPDVETRQYKTV